MSKEIITGALIELEITTYNDDWKVLKRRPVKFGVFEADIPEAVMAYLKTKTEA